jgi:hypothetical protein
VRFHDRVRDRLPRSSLTDWNPQRLLDDRSLANCTSARIHEDDHDRRERHADIELGTGCSVEKRPCL